LKCVRGIVDVFDPFETIQGMFNIIKCDINHKIHLLLPVGGLGRG
jgi:hypothetical protein